MKKLKIKLYKGLRSVTINGDVVWIAPIDSEVDGISFDRADGRGLVHNLTNLTLLEKYCFFTKKSIKKILRKVLYAK